ncbi:MAG: deoxyribonuclease IV, partial [Actinomycetota bacterium]|nr:deoxyribonuclease IV [Actinomycetota bacterium]
AGQNQGQTGGMLFGAHVRQTGGLEAALARGEERGLEVVQVFTQSPRRWAPTSRDADALAACAARRQASPVVQAWVCHATYLINLASPDPAVWERSRNCLTENLRVATAIGATGLVVHVGSHVGAGLPGRLPAIAEALGHALDAVPDSCPILLENAAGAGGTVGRTVEELAAVVDAVDGHPRIGVCLDSQHLWASGIPFGTPEQMDSLLTGVDAAVGLGRLQCLHLNDSVVGFGANRDRHANLGEGTIGDEALAAFLGHPAVQHLPVVMEFAGYGGDGADAKDLEVARRLHEEGVALYR